MKKIYTLLVLMSVSCSYIFAQIEGTWRMAPIEASLAVGPEIGSTEWWSSAAGDVDTRACYFDDQYVFNADGTFQNVMQGETWLEAWQGVAADECGAPVAPHDGSADATWAYDENAGTLTLTGLGAYLGLPKVLNGAEIDNPANAADEIVYDVAVDGNNMTVDINFGAGWWRYNMERAIGANVGEVVKNQFSVYPNPATSEITINSEEEIDQLTIRDITGKILEVRQNLSYSETINISGFSAGFYLLESKVGNQVSVEKLIVN